MFLSLMLLIFNNGYKSANRFLAGVFFFGSMFYLTIFVFFFGESLFYTAIFEASVPSFFYLIGPLSYFYVRSVLRDDVRLSKLDYLHFLLFAVIFLGTLPILFSSWEHKLEIARNILNENWFHPHFKINFFITQRQNTVLKGLHLFAYLVLIWYTFYKSRMQLKQNLTHTKQYQVIRNWLLILCILITLVTVAYLSAVYQMVVFQNKNHFLQMTYYQTLIMALGYLILILVLMFNPYILYGLPLEKKVNRNRNFLYEELNVDDLGPVEEEGRTIPGLYSFEYLSQIQLSIIFSEKNMHYLDPSFRLERISTDSGIPVHHLSYYFKNFHSLKYTDWRNNLRIQQAIKLITEGALSYHSFEGIFYMCGFTDQSTFIRAFKKNTGMTPSDFYKSLEKGDLKSV